MPEEEFTRGESGVELRVEPPKGPTVYESGKPAREDTSEAGRRMFEEAHTPPTAEEREAARREHNAQAEKEREAAANDPNQQRTTETVRTPDTHPVKRGQAPRDEGRDVGGGEDPDDPAYQQKGGAKPADKQAAKPADKSASDDLDEKKVAELRDMARDQGVEGFSTMKKAELVKALR